jgi:hypothetical protein
MLILKLSANEYDAIQYGKIDIKIQERYVNKQTEN